MILGGAIFLFSLIFFIVESLPVQPKKVEQPTRIVEVVRPEIVPEKTILEKATNEIPGILAQVYRMLDAGNPAALSQHLDENLKRNYSGLDEICRPFSYRSHYIEAMFQNTQTQCEVRVRVLFKPINEEPQVLIFNFKEHRFLLANLISNGLHDYNYYRRFPDEYKTWFKVEEETASEVARKFLYAAKDKQFSILKELAVSGIPTGHYLTNSAWIEYFNSCRTVHLHEIGWLKYKGLKVRVKLSVEGNYRGWGSTEAEFLLENINGEEKIVWAAPLSWMGGFGQAEPGVKPHNLEPGAFAFPEDPEMESRTLSRFGLSSKNN
jgi:hypothetical protein